MKSEKVFLSDANDALAKALAAILTSLSATGRVLHQEGDSYSIRRKKKAPKRRKDLHSKFKA